MGQVEKDPGETCGPSVKSDDPEERIAARRLRIEKKKR